MRKKVVNKRIWSKAIGAAEKSKRLCLKPDEVGLYHCVVDGCETEGYTTKRGCRKHIFNKHGWYFYFDKRPDISVVLPDIGTSCPQFQKAKRTCTRDMPSFSRNIKIGEDFCSWLQSAAGGSKSMIQSDQIRMKLLKFLKFCCREAPENYQVTTETLDYCLGSVKHVSNFSDYLNDNWKVGYSGIIGYMNAIAHCLDFRRIFGASVHTLQAFSLTEVYITRLKRSMAKKMRLQWKTTLSVEYLDSVNCWASLRYSKSDSVSCW